ncbi:MAG: hypothetical protein Q7S37_00770 [bacterium]|nr:hypothetical protein [bacterium]
MSGFSPYALIATILVFNFIFYYQKETTENNQRLKSILINVLNSNFIWLRFAFSLVLTSIIGLILMNYQLNYYYGIIFFYLLLSLVMKTPNNKQKNKIAEKILENSEVYRHPENN